MQIYVNSIYVFGMAIYFILFYFFAKNQVF